MVGSVDRLCSAPTTKPRRQRIHKQPSSLSVPDINDNAAERKRVLNVLAQRRYRKIAQRERKRQTPGRGPSQSSAIASESCSGGNEPRPLTDVDTSQPAVHHQDNEPSLSIFLNGTSASGYTTAQFPDLTNTQSLIPDIFFGMDDAFTSTEGLDPPLIPSSEECSTIPSPLLGADSILAVLGSSSPATPSLSEDSDLPVSVDSYYLPVNELTLMRGLLRIANRLQCNAQTLPPTWQPTFSQRSIPHHPVIDLFPWPSVRDRILLLLTLPDEARPTVATGPLAIVQLAYDLEDVAEGARIWGGDPCMSYLCFWHDPVS
ncbi:hypothetical protein F5Y18DRAFT_424922 [Xylariaceae sp. FL1019]|nr:hypothetical protein F5Y18DRAFT_424922 [Xylariaceae sp. FL1019]